MTEKKSYTCPECRCIALRPEGFMCNSNDNTRSSGNEGVTWGGKYDDDE